MSPKTAIIALQKIKQKSEDMDYTDGIARCNIAIMNYLVLSWNSKEAIKIGRENESIAEKTGNAYYISQNYRILAASYLNIDLLDEGQRYLNKALAAVEKIKDQDQKNFELSLLYSAFATMETMRTNNPVLIQKWHYKELHALEQIKDTPQYIKEKYNSLSFLYMNMGVVSNESSNPGKAEFYFRKALGISDKFKLQGKTPAIIRNELSWLLFDNKKYDSCIHYAQIGIRYEKMANQPIIRRDLYEVLYKSYTELGSTKNADIYGKLYMKLNDSIINAENKEINEPVKEIIKEREKQYKNRYSRVLLIFGGAIILLLLSLSLVWKKNRKKLHLKYENIISQLKAKETSSIKDHNKAGKIIDGPETLFADKNINIHDNTINTILQKLEKFEKSERYLRKDKNLTSLASSLETNPRYLSEIIKQYRGKNFNNYLNGLRIQHIIQLLYKEPIYREYKITYLAEYCGFASREVFAAAFKKETGVTPSYFINQLRDDEVIKNT
ncbi:AraC family transcriptional regulator [uncultured Chryseobacterium sp.]|uniref:helix-turn-helix domain-containing protein n=1 Tax=uncultured Chryseobacterium sp. TaxID=259322 RepID=UPI0025F4E209|nr:AraC family transcriptional regulator [uncultured Chryseobacterium sp.]